MNSLQIKQSTEARAERLTDKLSAAVAAIIALLPEDASTNPQANFSAAAREADCLLRDHLSVAVDAALREKYFPTEKKEELEVRSSEFGVTEQRTNAKTTKG